MVEILQIYTMHNLQHRAQVMTTLLNEIPLKIRQGTVLQLRINIKLCMLNAIKKTAWICIIRFFQEK